MPSVTTSITLRVPSNPLSAKKAGALSSALTCPSCPPSEGRTIASTAVAKASPSTAFEIWVNGIDCATVVAKKPSETAMEPMAPSWILSISVAERNASANPCTWRAKSAELMLPDTSLRNRSSRSTGTAAAGPAAPSESATAVAERNRVVMAVAPMGWAPIIDARVTLPKITVAVNSSFPDGNNRPPPPALARAPAAA